MLTTGHCAWVVKTAGRLLGGINKIEAELDTLIGQIEPPYERNHCNGQS